MSENETDNRNDPRWRDPLSLGWQAHRRLLLLKLRWHQSSARRGALTGGGTPPTPVHTLGRRQHTR